MGINREVDDASVELRQRLTESLRLVAGGQWGDSLWPLTTHEHEDADEMCKAMAEKLLIEFDFVPKDQQQYAICEWNPHYVEPGRGVWIGAWVPSKKWKREVDEH